ncbi:hypothetical protein [Kutzneria sp. NPDC052558]|uniref:hypothetical protein n=1 Tax=Kutzneria sp. NPDC052558 TaxID=3364121 RepID=UPI0037C7993D
MLAMLAFTPSASAYSMLGQSSSRPAITVFNGEFFAWKGVTGDNSIWTATINRNGQSVAKSMYARTDIGPALAGWGNRVALAWKGDQDSRIYVATSGDGTNWSPPSAVTGSNTLNMPTMAVFDNVLYVAWRGPDSGLYMTWTLDGTSWGAVQHAVPDGGSGDAPSLTATNTGIAMAWRGLNSDSRLFYSRYANNRWAPQQIAAPGANSLSPPALVPARSGPNLTLGTGLRLAWRETEFRVMSSYMEENGPWKGPVGVPNGAETPTRSLTGPNLIAYNNGDDPRIVWLTWHDHLTDRVLNDQSIIPS